MNIDELAHCCNVNVMSRDLPGVFFNLKKTADSVPETPGTIPAEFIPI